MPKFLRDALSYVVVAVAAGALVFTQMPAKVVVDTHSISTAAPEYAQKYMDAICAFDAEYLGKNTSPGFAGAQEIADYIDSAAQSGWGCESVKYLGSYQTVDKQVFAVVVKPSGNEVFYLFTFDAERLVINIE